MKCISNVRQNVEKVIARQVKIVLVVILVKLVEKLIFI